MEIINLLHYKKAYCLYFLLKNKSHNHIILSGTEEIGKSYLVTQLFSFIYPSKLFENVSDNYCFTYNNDYYYIDCKTINQKTLFLEFIKGIVSTYNHYNNHSKYIILDHFEYMNQTIQNSLKVIIEKCVFTSKIIIITNRYNKIIQPIKSRCFNIRISPSIHDNYLYLQNFFEEKQISYNPYLLFEDCKKYKLSFIINKYTITKYTDINEILYKQFCRLIYHQTINLKLIGSIRKFSSTIKEINIPIQQFLKRYIKENWICSQKRIQFIAEKDHLLQKSYRELIHIEAIILNLNNQINN